MSTWVWLAAAIALVVALPGAAAQESGIVAAPIQMHGAGTLLDPTAEGTLIHHRAFANDSLRFVVLTGTLDAERYEPNTLLYEQATDFLRPGDEITLATDSVAIIRWIGPAPLLLNGALLGPNPLRTLERTASADPPVDLDFFRAFPDEDFLLVPDDDLPLGGRVELLVTYGEVRLTSLGQADRTYRAGSVPAPESLTQQRHDLHSPADGPSDNRSLNMIHVVRVEAALLDGTIHQEDAERPQEYWRGSMPLHDPQPNAPTGHWPRNASQDLGRAWSGFYLPATSITAHAPAIHLIGVLQVPHVEGVTTGTWLFDALGPQLDARIFELDFRQADLATAPTGRAVALEAARPIFTGESRSSLPTFGFALALSAAGLVAWAHRGPLGIGLLLPARLTRTSLETHEIRKRIVELLTRAPGLTATEVRRELDVGWGTVLYHLRVLSSNRLVFMQPGTGRRRYFVPGTHSVGDSSALAILRSESARQLLRIILEHPGITLTDLAAQADLAPSTLNWHVKRLRQADLVTLQRGGRFVRANPGPRAASCLGASPDAAPSDGAN